MLNLLQISTMPPPSDSVKNELFLFESERFLWGGFTALLWWQEKTWQTQVGKFIALCFFQWLQFHQDFKVNEMEVHRTCIAAEHLTQTRT